MQRLAQAGVGFQVESEIGLDLILIQKFEVSVRPAMRPNLEKGIGQELLGSPRVMQEPFAAWKKSRLGRGDGAKYQ